MRKFVGFGIIIFLWGCQKPASLTTHGQPVSYWIEALKEPDAKVRKKAVVALGHAVTVDPAALPALTGAVKDRDTGVRREAVLALLNLGPQARDAAPALTDALKDKDAKVREYASKALARVQSDTK
jgi:HEAT repeat protein